VSTFLGLAGAVARRWSPREGNGIVRQSIPLGLGTAALVDLYDDYLRGMELHVDDDGFVRAPRGLVYRRLTDLGAWPTFWPGATVARRDGTAESFELTLRGSRFSRPLRLVAAPGQWRHDEGFRLSLQGDVDGEAEFWLEQGWGGTVVHHLATLHTTGRGRAELRSYRAALRRGLCGLKDDAQTQVRTHLGMRP
jgi:hypothetical protein